MRLALLFGIVLAGATVSVADDTVRYSLAPVMAKGKLEALAIELRFEGDADGETVLNLPNEWGGFKELYQGVRDLQISGVGVAVQSPEVAKRIVTHAPRAVISVRYRVVQYWPGEPAASGGNEYRPIVQPGYFQVLGNAVFVAPERDSDTGASFAIKELPRSWSFASDLEHGAMGRKLVLGDIIESVLVGGDFRVLRRGPLRVAIRGKWSFTDDAFVGQLERIVASHYKFWRDADEPYLVTVLPLQSKPGQLSVGGTGRSDAFAFFATGNADNVVLNRILAHEDLHIWIPRRIGGMPEDANEARDYWLSEGFTDFYTTRLLIRDGIWTLDEYVRETNELLFAYSNSSARTEPNSRIIADFWNDPEVGKLPYRRGQLLATIWDARVRAATGGRQDLDDVVLAMKSRASSATSDKPPVASVLFAEEMKRAGVDVLDDLAKFVEKGEAVLLPENIFAPCGMVATLDLATFDRGFDPEKTGENDDVIVGLRENSPAHRAGLRNGMKLLKRESGKTGDSRVTLAYRVLDNGVERVISYKPEGEGRMTLQEFTLQPNLSDSDRQVCIVRLGGT